MSHARVWCAQLLGQRLYVRTDTLMSKLLDLRLPRKEGDVDVERPSRAGV